MTQDFDKNKHNIRYIFKEFDLNEVEIDPKWGVVWPVEGPSILKMYLSKRQLKDLKEAIGKTDDKLDVNEITIFGRIEKYNPVETCQCEIISLMQKGCTCGKS
jgi:hypothetical protein